MPNTPKLPDEITFEQIKEYKFENVCQQSATRGVRPFRATFASTSFFINKNFLLTSAHNLVRTTRNVNALRISPARLGENHQLGKFHLYNVTRNYTKIYPGYKFGKQVTWAPYDLALMYIPDSVLSKNTVFTYQNNLPILEDISSLQVGEKIYCPGYPDEDEHKGRNWMTFDTSEILEIKEHYFTHTLATKRGNSGSPILVKRNDQFYVIGINSIKENGTLINSEKLSWIEKNKKVFLP